MLLGKSTQMIAAFTVLLGMATISVPFRFKGVSTSPVTVNCHSAKAGFASVSAAALFVGEIEVYARLIIINAVVMIVTISAKAFFNRMPLC